MKYFIEENNFKKHSEVKSVVIWGEKIINEFPLITIAIPTYERLELLKNAINSVLNQEDFEQNYEIIVVDNNSKIFDLESLPKDSRITYYKNEENIGMFGNWNRCIELARGTYISILNDDDWLEPEFLKESFKLIKDNSKMAIFTQANIQDMRKENYYIPKQTIVHKILGYLENIKKTRKFNSLDFLYSNRSWGSLGIVFHRDSLIKLGGYNENNYPSSDYFFHAKYVHKNGGIQIKKKLCNYRIQNNESMKFETASLWPRVNYDFRSEISEIIKFNKEKELLHIKNFETKQLNYLWNLELPYDQKQIKRMIRLKLIIRERMKSIFG